LPAHKFNNHATADVLSFSTLFSACFEKVNERENLTYFQACIRILESIPQNQM